ncbi:MAG TPA: SBBP repeat-containing protein [Verrucomicrobiae bacterium]
MKLSVKKILGTGVALGLAVGSLGAQSAAQFGNLPLWFEAGSPAQFTAHASDSEFTITPAGAKFSLTKNTGENAGCDFQFVGANPSAHISGDAPLTGTINYFFGSNPNQWRTAVPTFARVRVENIYPGVNVVYYGNRQKLEYDFNLAAGVNPSVIALHFAGAEKISVDAQGALVISFNSGEVIQHPPVAYQTIHGARQEIAANYKILDAHTAAFVLGDYNHNEPLVIDPVLSFSTYYGGNLGEIGWAIAVNPIDGSIYVAGQTFSSKVTNNISFSTAGAYQTNYRGGKQAGDAFVARFDETGTNLIYATYLGGSSDDAAYAIAVDEAGDAFITGATISTNFPVKNPIASGNKINGKVDSHLKAYPTDAFVTELDPSGSTLIYSTYIGGNSSEAAYGIALDSDDNAYITGFTYSTNFPVTPGAFQPKLGCTNTVYINANAFVSEISAGGTTLNYSTYLGGTNFDEGRALAYNNGKLFVTGYTASTNFPTTNYLPAMVLIDTNYYTKTDHGILVTNASVFTNYFSGEHLNGSTNKNNLASDAFVTAFSVDSPTSFTLLYSTFLGGTNNDRANSIAADADGNAYVAGYTTSTNFPDTVPGLANSYVHTNGFRYANATNGFLTQIKWDGTNSSVGYSSMFGGRGVDVANGVALDPDGNAYVIGSASSTNFPTYNTGGDLSATNHYIKKRFKSDVVVIAFNPDASALLYSCYLGGMDNDNGNAIAVDPLGNAYLTGQTTSTNFPTVNAFQSYRNGTNDMFLAKISQTAPPQPVLVVAPKNSQPSVQSKIAGVPTPAKSSLTLKWQMFPANYTVESSTDMTTWFPANTTPVYSNGWYHATLPTTNGSQFFRLHKR